MKEQDLFRFPVDAYRHDDPETSAEAAKSVDKTLSRDRGRVLRLIRNAANRERLTGMTDEEIEHIGHMLWPGKQVGHWRKRRSELSGRGLVRFVADRAGEAIKRVNTRNRQMLVWVPA